MEASHDLVYVWLNKLDVDGQKKSNSHLVLLSIAISITSER